MNYSSGSYGRVRDGGEKHEIYAAASCGHLFYDLFSQGGGGGWYGRLGPHPPGTATELDAHNFDSVRISFQNKDILKSGFSVPCDFEMFPLKQER